MFNQALGEVEVLFAEATACGRRPGSLADRPRRGSRGRAAAGRCPGPSTDRRATAHVQEAIQAAAAAENDQKLLARLVTSAVPRARMIPTAVRRARSYARLPSASRDRHRLVARRPRRRRDSRACPSPVSVAWRPHSTIGPHVGGEFEATTPGVRRLTELARLADPDPWRNRLRTALQIPVRYRAADQTQGTANLPTDGRLARD